MFKGKRCLQRRWRTSTWRWSFPKAKLSKHFEEGGQWWEEGWHIDKDLGNLVVIRAQYGIAGIQTNL